MINEEMFLSEIFVFSCTTSFIYIKHPRSRDNTVGMTVRLSPIGSRIFNFSMSSRPAVGSTQPNLLYNGYWGLFCEGKVTGV
jgi:hypothetical protein